MTELRQLMREAIDREATDIHLTVGLPPIFRIDGSLVNAEEEALTEKDVRDVALLLASDRQMEEFKTVGEVDFAVTYRDMVRLRCNFFHQQGCTALALRLLPLTIPTCEWLQLPKIIVDQAKKPRGLVLVTGPTGSGKSSTLAALIDHINRNQRRHIITLEDPIEFIHSRDKCIINQREVGQDTGSFAAGLRAALRQDPDVILVGEMRDLETISTAITAAETGHLVFATLHTKGVANTIDRIIDSFPAEQQGQIRIQLADVLECAIGQTLVPMMNGGRRAAYEIMVATPAIRSLIRQSKTFQIVSAMQTGKQQGMQLLDEALVNLVRTQQVSLRAAMELANDPAAMADSFR